MDDELEDKVFYQTYISHMRLLSKFVMGISPLNSTMAYIWKVLRLYCMRPEFVLFALLCIIFVSYIHMLESWSQSVMRRFGVPSYQGYRSGHMPQRSPAERHSWEETHDFGAVYAVQGRRPRMEDRYVIRPNIDGTQITVFGILDGHGGEFAAVFAKDHLMTKLCAKIKDASDIANGKVAPTPTTIKSDDDKPSPPPPSSPSSPPAPVAKDGDASADTPPNPSRRGKLFKTMSTDVDCGRKPDCKRDDERRLTLDNLLNANGPNARPIERDANHYVDKDKKLDFHRMITDLVLLTDYELIVQAKQQESVAGSTLLLAVFYESQLIVANVGDSRGVMCDGKDKVIPMSFDHKPNQSREAKRIQEAGGFIQFKGVWRVNGILATSRALGDFPLKERNHVIANPDILTFELNDLMPKFIILASDGLWDTFSNEEAVAFIRERLHKSSHFGAKDIVLESYNRGSVDNITVMVIVFRNGQLHIGSS